MLRKARTALNSIRPSFVELCDDDDWDGWRDGCQTMMMRYRLSGDLASCTPISRSNQIVILLRSQNTSRPTTPSLPPARSAYISYSRVPSFRLSSVAFSVQRFSARASSCAWLDGDVTFLSGTIYMQTHRGQIFFPRARLGGSRENEASGWLD